MSSRVTVEAVVPTASRHITALKSSNRHKVKFIYIGMSYMPNIGLTFEALAML